jgi:hypothetical protein
MGGFDWRNGGVGRIVRLDHQLGVSHTLSAIKLQPKNGLINDGGFEVRTEKCE